MTRQLFTQRKAYIKPLFTGLRVRNLKRSIRFYRVLGYQQTLRMKTALGECAQFEHRNSRFTIELNYFPKGSRAYESLREGTELDHFGFEVRDVDAWVNKLCRAGAKLKMKPFNAKIIIHEKGVTHDCWERGRAAFVADPDGIWIELMEPFHSKENEEKH
jgi:catechol 2,3-dioxygenase-like lactoylglutathione lyase family enzyme